MSSQIHIPEPCHEDWDEMQPESNGRHCLQCSKTVVDFTGWEMQDIVDYLKHTRGNTCGRFTADQVQAPVQPKELIPYVFRATIPFYRKLAAIIVLFFGLSVAPAAAQQQKGEIAIAPAKKAARDTTHCAPLIMGGISAPPPAKDTVRHQLIMGKPAPPHPVIKGRVAPVKPKQKTKKPVTRFEPPRHLQGDVEVVEEPIKPPAPPQTNP